MSSIPTRALCVGGPHHGEYLPTFDTWEVRVPRSVDTPAFDAHGPVLAPVLMHGTYQLRRANTPDDMTDNPIWVLFWRGWSM